MIRQYIRKDNAIIGFIAKIFKAELRRIFINPKRRIHMDHSIEEEQLTSERVPKAGKRVLLHFTAGKLKVTIGPDVAWYWDIRLWALPLLILFIIALLPGEKKGTPTAQEEPQIVVQETVPVETTPPATTAPEVRDEEAEALARLADTVGAGRTDNVKTVIMWVAVNRSEDRANGYGKSIIEEIARPSQWQFYDENGMYSDGSYKMALEILRTKRLNGLRPIDNDMLWFVLNDDGSITVRNRFNFGKNTKVNERTYK